MATTLQLRGNIKKLKKALEAKGISPAIKTKLKAQLDKAESELASSKKSGKAPKASVVKGGASSLSKLQKLIQKKKYAVYQGQGVDLERDSDKPAKPIGKRKSKSGKRYYEYRANRIDVKQPPKTYPKLEKGGYMADGGEINNQYEGKSAEQVWGMWSTKQRLHFIRDHYLTNLEKTADKVGYMKAFESANEMAMSSWDKLPSGLQSEVDRHIYMGQYASGGYMEDGGMIDEAKQVATEDIDNMSDEEIAEYLGIQEDEVNYAYREDAIQKRSEYYLQIWKDMPDDEHMAKGGYMAEGRETHRFEKGGNLKSIKDKYEENEDNNAHSENVVLLAKHFGTKEDLAEAKEILALHEKEGHLTSENGKKRQELHLKLIEKAREKMSEKGIEFEKGGYMEKGGSLRWEDKLRFYKIEGKLKDYPANYSINIPKKDWREEARIGLTTKEAYNLLRMMKENLD